MPYGATHRQVDANTASTTRPVLSDAILPLDRDNLLSVRGGKIPGRNSFVFSFVADIPKNQQGISWNSLPALSQVTYLTARAIQIFESRLTMRPAHVVAHGSTSARTFTYSRPSRHLSMRCAVVQSTEGTTLGPSFVYSLPCHSLSRMTWFESFDEAREECLTVF